MKKERKEMEAKINTCYFVAKQELKIWETAAVTEEKWSRTNQCKC